MKLIIDIDEQHFELLQMAVMNGMGDNAQKIIAQGTPLPKGHGRLIDADEFHHTLEDMPIRDNDKWFNWLQKACNRLAEAPTIIEADKESEE